ncbi:hypothetical protein Gotur_022653, partial [Gossypium turneri]
QFLRSASGLVVRIVRGEILASKSVIHFNIATPFAAEAHVGLQAIKLGIFMGFNVLQIIRDSRTVITKCQCSEYDKLTIGALKKGEGHYLVGDIPSFACCVVERKRPRHPAVSVIGNDNTLWRPAFISPFGQPSGTVTATDCQRWQLPSTVVGVRKVNKRGDPDFCHFGVMATEEESAFGARVSADAPVHVEGSSTSGLGRARVF